MNDPIKPCFIEHCDVTINTGLVQELRLLSSVCYVIVKYTVIPNTAS